MGMLYEVSYRYPNGDRQAGVDVNVGRGYVDRMIGCKSDRTYAIATNTNWDGHTIYIDPSGRVVEHDQLPWVIAERKAEQEAAHQKNKELLNRGYALMKKRNVRILKRRPDVALISVDSAPAEWIEMLQIEDAATQPDTGDGLVPFYRALRHAIQHHHNDPA